MQDFQEIGAIWRGETRRALKSGRVLVLLILFLLFVGLALAITGWFSHQISAQVDQQIAMAGAHADEVRAAVQEEALARRKNMLSFVVAEEMIDSLAKLPLALFIVFKLTLVFLTLFIALMGFDQISGEVGPKSMRYLVVRAKRSSIVLGKALSQATLFGLLLGTCTILMVAVSKLLNPEFATTDAIGWTVKLILSSFTLSLAYLSLTTLFSALTRQGGVSLVLNIIALFLIWFVSLIGRIWRLPGEVAAPNTLAMLKSESWLAYTRYASVWNFSDDLLHPDGLRWFTAALVHVGFALVFVGLALLVLQKRDL